MLIHRYPLFDESTDTPDGGGAAATPEPEPVSSIVDDSDLMTQFEKLSAGGGDAHSADAPAEKKAADDGHPVGASGEAGSGEAPTFDADLLDRARLFGLDDATINTHADALELERTLFVLGKHLIPPAAGDPEPADPAQQPAQPPANPQQQTQTEATQDAGESLMSLLPKDVRDDLDPSVVKLFEAVDQRLGSVKALEQQVQSLSGLQAHIEQQRVQDTTRGFDEAAGTLGEEFAEVYGNGDSSKLTRAQLKKREELWNTVQAICEVREIDPFKGLKDKSLLKQAAISLNGDHYEKHLTRRLSDRAKNNHRGSRVLPNAPAATPNPPKVEDGEDPELVALFNKKLAAGA